MTREEAIKILMGYSHTPQERAALEALIPELAESEDERMIKAILSAIRGGLDTEKFLEKHGTNYEEVEAYLEKQKEQIPYTDFVIKPHKGDDNNPYDMRVSEAQEYAIKRGFGIPFNDGEVYVDERHLTQTIGNILRWADEHPREQKPVDDKAFEEWINDWWKHNKVNNLDSYDKGDEIQFDERGFKNFCRGIRNMYAEQKPAEWSEEDENVLELLHELIGFGFTEKFFDAQTAYDMRNWVNTRLKSLRPSWKPSKKQMDALAWYSGNSAIPPTGDKAIQSLYNDLKKLM